MPIFLKKKKDKIRICWKFPENYVISNSKHNKIVKLMKKRWW